jgi:acyl carrier protein
LDPKLNAEIKALIVEALDLRSKKPSDIEDDVALFGEGLKLDSLDALQLAVALEERFGVEVPEGEEGRRTFASVSAIARFIAQARAASGR